jgi:SAM-dependent methyltransferase
MGRIPVPPWLKRYLVSAWNEAHRLGWLVRDYGSAILLGRFETCPVCGRLRPILYRRRVIPRRLEELWGLSPRLAEALARKESCDCAGCGAKLRARRMARVILRIYQVGSTPAPARSLAEWAASPQIRRLRVAEINRIEGIHEQLAILPGFRPSDYQPGTRAGELLRGIRSEDLTRLTYESDAFDLVLTSETLEHVPDLDAALGEIRRVLIPGGRHIFTVPRLPGVAETSVRAVLRPDGSLDHRAPAICHPGGDVGYPVFTEFGADLPQVLRRAGFEVAEHFGPATEDDLAQVYVCRKPDREPIDFMEP